MQKSPLSNDSLGRSGAPSVTRRFTVALLLGVALLYGFRLGHLDFWAPDEPRYGAIAEEIRSFRHGPSGLVLLHTGDVPYTQKPPLYFWLAAAVGAPSGHVSEWAARFPSALAGLVCVALTAWIGRRLLDNPFAALLAAGILATSFRFAFTARRAQLDVLLTSFELISIAIFVWHEFREPGQRRQPSPSAITAFHASLGAAALVKGPVGWLPLAIIATYLAWEGRARNIQEYTPIWALFLSIAPVCLWIGTAIALAPSGFAEIAVGENLVGRFFSGTSHARPFYYFLFQGPADFMPWSLLLPFGAVRIRHWLRNNESEGKNPPGGTEQNGRSLAPPELRSKLRFVLTWIALPLVFFSLSAGKRGVYLLPVFPAFALVSAISGSRLTTYGQVDRAAVRAMTAAIALIAAIELGLFAFAAPLLEREKSPRPIAEAIARHTSPAEQIGVYGLEPIEGAIRYYGDRQVVSLETEVQLEAFLKETSEPQVVLLRARHFAGFAEPYGLLPLARFRAAPRELVIAVSRATSSTSQGKIVH